MSSPEGEGFAYLSKDLGWVGSGAQVGYLQISEAMSREESRVLEVLPCPRPWYVSEQLAPVSLERLTGGRPGFLPTCRLSRVFPPCQTSVLYLQTRQLDCLSFQVPPIFPVSVA